MVKSMKIYKNFISQPQHKNSVILVGNFDGIHLGHQKLFSLAKKYKEKYPEEMTIVIQYEYNFATAYGLLG